MNRIGKRAKYLSILIVFFLVCGAVFFNDYRLHARMWVTHPSNKNIYKNGELTVAGTVYTADNTLLLSSNNNGLTYADDATIRKATLHLVGDSNNNITSGVLASHRNELIGYDILNGLYGTKNTKNTINLTINTDLTVAAYEALGNHNGAIAIYNYKTGKVECMVSKPSYDPYDVPDLTQEKYEGVYINRVMNGLYVPGSIMKLVTTYAALETIGDIHNQNFHCDHGMEVNGEWINCTGNHGDQNLKEALAHSCNAAYGQIAMQLGPEKLTEYAKKAGILSSYTIDGVQTSAGHFDVSNAATVELAWAGIGQYTTMVNPMQYLMFVAAIANDGIQVKPHYIDNTSIFSSAMHFIGKDEERVMRSETAQELSSLMRNNTIQTYGDGNYPGLNLCAKSGTAEVEGGRPHSWLVGFSDNLDTPFAFVIIVENGSTTDTTALSVSKKVLNKAGEVMKKQ